MHCSKQPQKGPLCKFRSCIRSFDSFARSSNFQQQHWHKLNHACMAVFLDEDDDRACLTSELAAWSYDVAMGQ